MSRNLTGLEQCIGLQETTLRQGEFERGLNEESVRCVWRRMSGTVWLENEDCELK